MENGIVPNRPEITEIGSLAGVSLIAGAIGGALALYEIGFSASSAAENVPQGATTSAVAGGLAAGIGMFGIAWNILVFATAALICALAVALFGMTYFAIASRGGDE